MAVTCEDFRIDVAHEQSFKYLQAKQYDHNSRKRRLIITDSNIPIQYSENRTEYIVLSMSDNGDNYANVTCPFESDGYPYITFTESILSHTGDIDCELRIFDSKNGNVITTFSFLITIGKSLLNHDRLVASSEFNVLNDLILQAIEIPDLINTLNLTLENANTLIIQINNNIAEYQQVFNEFSAEARGLINDIREFLSEVEASENARKNAEGERELAENQRKSNEDIRINEENARKNAEDIRVEAENNRNANEFIRQQTNKTAEALIDGMTTQKENYAAAEAEREANETNRQALYQSMTELENRVESAEEVRIQQENDRQTNIATAITNSEEATQAAWEVVNAWNEKSNIDDTKESNVTTYSSAFLMSETKRLFWRNNISSITIPVSLWFENSVYIKSDIITENSIIDIYYDNSCWEEVSLSDINYTQGNGWIKLTASYVPKENIIIKNIMVENYSQEVAGSVSSNL